jgi:hypothetical protein
MYRYHQLATSQPLRHLALILTELRLQITTNNTKDCAEPPFQGDQTHYYVASRLATALSGTVRMSWFIVLTVSHNSGRPTAGLSQD